MLALEEVILESDDDMEIWSSVVVGFDMSKNFVITLEHIDYEEHENDCKLNIIIDKNDAFHMSAFLHTKLTDLPKVILKKFGGDPGILVPSDVERAFKKIMDFVLDCGVHYELKRN